MSKHIALVSPTLGAGGAERTVILLANDLATRQDCRVSLIVASTQGEAGKLRAEVAPEVELVDFNCQRVANLAQGLPAWLRTHRPDVLVSSQTHTNIMCYFVARWSGFKGRVIAREVSTPSVNLKHLTGLKKTAMQVLMRYVYRRVSHIVPVSEGVAEDLQRYLGSSFAHMTVIYDPVISDTLYARAREAVQHPWFAEDRACPVVLAVGRLTEAKNYQLLIRAFADVVRVRDARLMILGEGEDRAVLEQLVRDLGLTSVVSLPGFDPNPFRYMAQCDAYVMSSQWEGLPGALIQALALGAPVISTDCPSGPREILQNGRLGRLVPNQSGADLKEALLLTLAAGALSDRTVETAAIQPYTVETTLQQYVGLFEMGRA